MIAQYHKLALTASLALAMALTFSCSGDDGGDNNHGTAKCGAYNPSTEYCSNGTVKVYGSVTDNAGKSYKTVVIGTQAWMAENLNYDVPDNATDVYYDNDPDKCATYGRLYNWSTAMALPSKCNSTLSTSDAECAITTPNHQGICPSGWHIPSGADWNVLMKFVNPSCTDDNRICDGAGKKLKADSPLWNDNGKGTDDFGFAALPGGNGISVGGFSSVGNDGLWWSASEDNAYYAYSRIMYYNDEYAHYTGNDKRHLFSVRCLQN